MLKINMTLIKKGDTRICSDDVTLKRTGSQNNYSKLKPLKIGSQDYVVSTD